jgi:hypothetical protein
MENDLAERFKSRLGLMQFDHLRTQIALSEVFAGSSRPVLHHPFFRLFA